MSEAAEDPGVEGNTRLTSSLGMLLIALLAVEGFTLLNLDQMISLHVALGLILVGPVVAKCLTTGYRFVRYYGRQPAYRRKGPPHIVLRVLGPVVIVTSLAVLGTGVALVYRPHQGPWLLLHKASFILWVGAMTIHVLGHIAEGVQKSVAELRRPVVRGLSVRVLALAIAVVAGVGVALAIYPSASSWTSHHAGFQDQEGHVKQR